MDAQEKVQFEERGGIAIISLNRPAQRNALDGETSDQLRAAIDRLEREDHLRVGILRGNGPVFCAGLDLNTIANNQADEVLFGPDRFGGLVSRTRSKPLIAAVQKAALAGGFELALACDLIVASKEAIFGLPESKRGLVAGGGGAIRMAQSLPKVIANEILLLGEPFGAEDAKKMGLINRVVEAGDLEKASLDLAEAITKNAPLSIRASLELSRSCWEGSEEESWQLNDRLLKSLIDSEDAAEGAVAFKEKRPAVWQNR
ncbi:MAG: enoyl-CoA hydratase-related protein [Cohaesibacter sp.]|jgi:enoyl-CoA hydratase|nr:enoyl-CoA hydratase-related protein [Cohaesibacter sp.]